MVDSKVDTFMFFASMFVSIRHVCGSIFMKYAYLEELLKTCTLNFVYTARYGNISKCD
jgi:hypothetical protein